MILGKLFSIIPKILKTAIGSAGSIASGSLSAEDDTLIEDNQVIDTEDQNIETTSIIDRVTPELVKKVFIYTQLKNIQDNLPLILHALDIRGLGDKEMICYSLATILVENDKFKPMDEIASKYSDLDGAAPYDFSRYDVNTSLGNTPEKDLDGARWRGRGLVMITGLTNYKYMDKALGLDGGLLDNPDAANEPHIAANIFGVFIKDRESGIRQALSSRDFKKARSYVNGKVALHWEKLQKAYEDLEKLLS